MKKAKRANMQQSIRDEVPWKRHLLLLGKSVAVLVTLVGSLIAYLAYIDSQPKIVVSLSAFEPVFVSNTSQKWDRDDVTRFLAEYNIVNGIVGVFPYLDRGNLLTSEARYILKVRQQALKQRLLSVRARLPIAITVSNNGGKDTTIIGSTLEIGTPKKVISRLPINDMAPVKVPHGEVHEFKRTINFGSSDTWYILLPLLINNLPDIIGKMGVAGGGEADKAEGQWQNELAEHVKLSLLKQIKAEISDYDIYDPIVLTVICVDQRGQESSGRIDLPTRNKSGAVMQ